MSSWATTADSEEQRPGSLGSNAPKRPDDNVWIEAKAADGKCYFYHSRTRETSWNRPENAVILTQEQFNASIRQHMPPPQGKRLR